MGSKQSAENAKKLSVFMPFDLMFENKPELKALAKAAGKGQIERIDNLVNAGQSVNELGTGSTSALFWAMRRSNLQGYQRLLQLGADPNVVFSDGGTVMHWAVIQKTSDQFLVLALKYGGNPNLVSGGYQKDTPLFSTLVEGFEDRFEILIEAGADIDFQDGFNQRTPVLAALLTQGELAYKLLELGADYTLKDGNGYDVAASVASGKIGTNKNHEHYRWLLKIERWLADKGVELPSVDQRGRLIDNPDLEK